MSRWWTAGLVLAAGCAAPAPVDAPPPPTAKELLNAAAKADHPQVRANAIEALAPAPDAQASALSFALVDENEGVRFVAAMSLGDGGHCELADLVRPLLEDPSRSVQAAALYALAKCDEEVDLTVLASMLLGQDPTERSNGALVLGKLGDATATGLLRSSLARPIVGLDARRIRLVELTTAEALVRLGSLEHLEEIRAAFFGSAEDGEIIALAAQMAGQLGDAGLGYSLEQMAFNTGPRPVGEELQLIAIEALGRLSPEAAQPRLALRYVDHEQPRIRAQAAAALAFGEANGQDEALAKLCLDDNPLVRVRAAGSVLHRAASRGVAN
ncbi:MAG: HEAT repeat domain-containing protein [Phycisphaerales bacterium]|nr:HEAT repeat domain-containing protein [Phycisphaerales bacterium]